MKFFSILNYKLLINNKTFKSKSLSCKLIEKKDSESFQYSDDLFQTIIKYGYKGLHKIKIPNNFITSNQEPDFGLEKFKENQKLFKNIVESFNNEINVSIAYGSGVTPQNGYQSKLCKNQQSDFIFLVKNNEKFHQKNIQQHSNHYVWKKLKIIKLIQGKYGVYFNPFVMIKKKLIKYGVVSIDSVLADLCEWQSMFIAGRLQKPIFFVKDNDTRVKFLNQFNLKNAMSLSIFLIKSEEFNEIELYKKITSISYTGDIRMSIGGENPNKIKNIVDNQFNEFKKLYEPIFSFFLENNYIIQKKTYSNVRVFKKNFTLINKFNLIKAFPLSFRNKLQKLYSDKTLIEIVKDPKLSENLTKVLRKIILFSSVKQLIIGFLSSGFSKSLKYAFLKLIKFLKGKYKL